MTLGEPPVSGRQAGGRRSHPNHCLGRSFFSVANRGGREASAGPARSGMTGEPDDGADGRGLAARRRAAVDAIREPVPRLL